MQAKKDTIAKRIRDTTGRIVVDVLAVTLVGGLLLAEKAKNKLKEFVEEQKVDKLPAL